jgi:hypothetical protein
MTSLYAAILILSDSGSAARTLETTDSIAGIVLQVAIGGVTDAIGRFTAVGNSEAAARNSSADIGRRLRKMEPTLRIDGTERTGILAWAGAAYRVAGYALDRRDPIRVDERPTANQGRRTGVFADDGAGYAIDREHGGRVAYSYRVSVRGYDVRRHTEISDGRVTLTTSIGWVETVKVGRLTRRIPIHVSIEIRASEGTTAGDAVTSLVGTATGTADTSDFHCRLVRRIADKRAAAELESGLGRVLLVLETTGRGWYAAGASDVLDAVRTIRIGER